MKKIRASVFRETGKIAFETLNISDPGPGQVLVKMVACGVCHTDSVVMNEIMPMPKPAVLGHEGAGIVEKCGPGVFDLKEGDHVVMSYPSCGVCEPCKEGRPYACEHISELFWGGAYADGSHALTDESGKEVAVMFGQGSFAEYAVANSNYCVKVDPDVDLRMVASLGCGIQTGAMSILKSMPVTAGSSIIVFGTGAVGLAAIMAAKIVGCSKIIACDIVPSRLELALEMGATDTINSKETPDVPAEVKKILGRGSDFAFESTGYAPLIVTALDCLTSGGTELFVSATGTAKIEFMPDLQLMTKCLTLKGVVEGGSSPKVDIPKLVQFYKEGKLPLEKITKFYSFDQIDEAFEASHSGKVIKPVLVF